MYIAALLVIAPNWKPKYLSTKEWIKTCSISRKWNIIQQKKGANYRYMQQHR